LMFRFAVGTADQLANMFCTRIRPCALVMTTGPQPAAGLRPAIDAVRDGSRVVQTTERRESHPWGHQRLAPARIRATHRKQQEGEQRSHSPLTERRVLFVHGCGVGAAIVRIRVLSWSAKPDRSRLCDHRLQVGSHPQSSSLELRIQRAEQTRIGQAIGGQEFSIGRRGYAKAALLQTGGAG